MNELCYIDKIGNMYVEKELVVGIEPVLFVCIDGERNRYLFLSYDSYEGVFVFCPISNDILVSMLCNRITMEQVFRKSDMIYETKDNGERLIADVYVADEYPGERLPLVGEYYELDSEEISEYIQMLQSEGEIYITQVYGSRRYGWDRLVEYDARMENEYDYNEWKSVMRVESRQQVRSTAMIIKCAA